MITLGRWSRRNGARSPAACAAFRYGLLAVPAAVCALALLHASDDLTLAAKARLFEVDLAERFLAADGQVRVRRRLPTADHPHVTYNMADTAYMTGLYCAAQTWRYLATGEPEAAARARAAGTALRHLVAVTGPSRPPGAGVGARRRAVARRRDSGG